MINKKHAFVLLLLLLIISISSVNAEEQIDDLDLSPIDVDIPLTDGESDNEIDENNTFEGNFNELNAIIENASDGSEINLETDYNGSGEIEISKNLTINGNNHIIDANSKSRIFSILGNNSIILNNIQFYNANSLDENGGAIFADAHDLKINNCQFINNHAMNGGAVYTNCKVEYNNCEFRENIANGNGGAVESAYVETVIKNSTFINNTAEVAGGAVLLERSYNQFALKANINNAMNTTIENTVFENNTANTGGGAIYSEHYLTIRDCEFNENYAYYGGAIYTYNGHMYQTSMDIYDRGAYAYTRTTNYIQRFAINITGKTIFKNNIAMEGAAIEIESKEDFVFNDPMILGLLIINEGAVFENNYARYGGALYLSSCEANITQASFINNTATVYGGAIFTYSLSNVSVKDSTFIDNDAGDAGGSIDSEYILNVTGCEFTNENSTIEFISNVNYMTSKNNTVYYMGGLYLSNNTMTGNPRYDIEYYGLIPLEFETKLTFKNITAKYGDSVNICELQDIDGNTLVIPEIQVKLTGTNGTEDEYYLFYNNKTKGYSIDTILLENITYEVTGNVSDYLSNCEIIPGTLKVSSVILNATDVVKPFGGDKNYTVTVEESNEPLADVNVTITVNGENYTVQTNSEGQASIPLNLKVGVYEITSQYDVINITTTVNVTSTILANDSEGEYLNTVFSAEFLDIAGNPLANKEVKFIVNDNEYNATTDENGKANVKIDLDVGNYTVEIVNLINNETKESKLIITQSESELTLNATQNTSTVTLTANINPKTATGEVVFTVKENNYTAYVENGTAYLKFEDLDVGTYDVAANYLGDNNLNASSVSSIFVVDKINTELTITNKVKTFGESSYPEITLTDENGKAMADANISVILNGETMNLKTNANGTATVDYDMDAGNYSILVNYKGSDKYKETSIYDNITVNKLAVEIKVSDLKKSYGDANKLTITLTDANGNPIANASVSAVISSSIYSGTTNDKGIALIDIPLAPNTYDSVISYECNTNYNNAINTAKIVVKKATPKLKAAKKTFKAKTKTKKYKIALKVNGKAMNKAKVTIKVNGKKYKAKTNSKGKATFKITNLSKKAKYKVAINYKGNKYYNKVTKTVIIKVK